MYYSPIVSLDMLDHSVTRAISPRSRGWGAGDSMMLDMHDRSKELYGRAKFHDFVWAQFVAEIFNFKFCFSHVGTKVSIIYQS